MSSFMSGNLTATDRSKRSILVGNIPIDANEDQMRIVLHEFGSIVDFKYFNDSSGNPVGYAFCEYETPDMAIRSISHLNNFNWKGQILRVDTVANDKTQAELENVLQLMNSKNIQSNVYSDFDATVEKAPEEISKAVASLPPEQMFELMKQMKMCTENNPHEARNLLLQNPQLAYALLQAQVIMRIVDLKVALQILDRPITVSAPNADNADEKTLETAPGALNVGNAPLFPSAMSVLANMPSAVSQAVTNIPPPTMNVAGNIMNMNDKKFSNDHNMRQLFNVSGIQGFNGSQVDSRFQSGIDPRMMQAANVRPVQSSEGRPMPVPDPRVIQMSDPRVMPVPDPRAMPVPDPRAIQAIDPRAMPIQDPRGMPVQDPRAMQIPDPRSMAVPDPRAMPVPDPRAMPVSDPRAMPIPDPRAMPGFDPRIGQDPRSISSSDPRSIRSQDPRQMQDPRRMMPGIDPRAMPNQNPKPGDVKMGLVDPRAGPGTDPRMSNVDPRMLAGDPRVRQASDPRMRPGSDPRIVHGNEMGNLSNVPRLEDPRKPPTSEGGLTPASRLNAGPRAPNMPPTGSQGNSNAPLSGPMDSLSNLPQDQEKAALIMQVLQLSDEQIAMLPPDQRQSILILKEQIARSHIS